MTFNKSEQIQHFKTLSHSEKYWKVKGIFSIVGDEVEEMAGLDDIIEGYGLAISDDDLVELYIHLMDLIDEYQKTSKDKEKTEDKLKTIELSSLIGQEEPENKGKIRKIVLRIIFVILLFILFYFGYVTFRGYF